MVWKGRALVIVLLLLGSALRLHNVSTAPPGLYHDEAQHGLDALAVLEGEPALYFPANNGREPLHIYLITFAVAILGRSPLAIRLPAFYVGFLTLAAAYDLGRTLWGAREGRWLLAILAVTFWHVHLSRMGFRAVLLPLFTTLMLSQAVKGLQSRPSAARSSALHWIAAGALYGVSWYTYIAARFTPVAIGAMLIYGLYCRRHRRRLGAQWRMLVLAASVALIVLLPLGGYTLAHPEIVLSRSGQVSVFSETIHGGRVWATLGDHILRTAAMFTVRGDRIWRHNLAWRPVWDPALGLAFVIGVGVAMGSLRREPAAALALIWTGIMAIPTVLAEDAPHFLRAVGVLPTAALLPTLGLTWITRAVDRIVDVAPHTIPREANASPPHIVGRLIPLLFIGIGLTSTVADYFFRYQVEPLTYHWLEAGPVALASQINAYRGAGWNGNRMVQATTTTPPEVYVDGELYAEWTAVPYLVPEAAVTFLKDDSEEMLEATSISQALFVVWPYRTWETDVLPALTRPAYIQVRQGPEAQGDLDPKPYSIAMLIEVSPRPEVPAPIAIFEEGIVLRAALVEAQPHPDRNQNRYTVNLWWEATQPISADYTVFVHYLREDARIAQHDGPPGLGHLPTTAWQPGDLILDQHTLDDLTPNPGIDRLRVGLYDPVTNAGLGLLDDAGAIRADALELPVILVEP
jgi:hypothetical protein